MSARPPHTRSGPTGPWRTPALARDDGRAAHLAAVQELGLPGVVDAHCHWFPERVMEKIWRYFDRHHWPIVYRGPAAERLAWLRRNGVVAFTTLNYAHRPGMAAWLNEWNARFAAETPGAVPCATFYPESGVGDYVRRAIEVHRCRAFKLHLHVSDFDPNLPVLTPAFERIQAAGLPVVIHCGSQPLAGRYTRVEVVERLLERFPRLVLVVAHMGAGEYLAYQALAERHPTVHLDTTMVFVDFFACRDYPPDGETRLAAMADKLLFGTDFPNVPYPLAHAVEGVLRLPLTPAQQRGVLYHNAVRLFGIDPAPGTASP